MHPCCKRGRDWGISTDQFKVQQMNKYDKLRKQFKFTNKQKYEEAKNLYQKYRFELFGPKEPQKLFFNKAD